MNQRIHPINIKSHQASHMKCGWMDVDTQIEKKHFASSWRLSQTWMTILVGYAKSSRDFIFARASQIWAIQSIKHWTLDVKFNICAEWMPKTGIKSWVLDWLNGSNLRCSSEDEISWTFCIAKQYGHSCLGKPSTRCIMLFCLFVCPHPSIRISCGLLDVTWYW